MSEIEFQQVTITLNPRVEDAPKGVVLMVWGGGGWRFMTRDQVGQWRSILGRAKPAPRLWAYPPEVTL